MGDTPGRIFASCGHEISDEWFHDKRSSVIRRSQAREGGRALSYEIVCEPCREIARKGGELFATEARAAKWLHAKQPKRVTSHG